MAKSQQGGQNKQPSGNNGGGTGIGGKLKGGAGDGVKSAGSKDGKRVIITKF